MILAKSNNYWISPSAIQISLNALGNPDYIQGSVTSGASILCYVKGIIDYDTAHNYRRWSLSLSPTVFGTQTLKYVYVAIPRDLTKTQAFVCFPSDHIDIYGKDSEGTEIGSEEYFYIYLGARISASTATVPQVNRTWLDDNDTPVDYCTINFGTLSTDEALDAGGTGEWYQVTNVNGEDLVTFIKDLTMKAGTVFRNFFATNATIQKLIIASAEFIGRAVYGTTPDTSDNTIVTPKYVSDFGNTLLSKYLRKDQDDETTHKLTMAHAEVKGNTSLKGQAVFGASASSDNFVTGAQTAGSGWQINHDGDIEGESIKVRGFMEVPEIRFNRASIIVGTNIQSPCAGIIDTVTPESEFTGIATLHLEDEDMAGSIQVGDLCWGYWHDISTKSNNATVDADDHKGSIDYKGFATVYFQVSEILNERSTKFRYELKPDTTLHPYVGMHFGGRGNSKLNEDGTPVYPDRQGFSLATPNYTATYQLVSSWDWSNVGKHIVRVSGLLDGFETLANVAPGTWNGYYGTIDCNLYLRGVINQVEATQRFLYITLSSNGMINEGETEIITLNIRNNYFQDVSSEFKIYVDNTLLSPDKDGKYILSYPYASLTDETTRFSVRAEGKTYSYKWNSKTQTNELVENDIVLTDSFSIRKLGSSALSIVTNNDNDPFIDQSAPRHIVCSVMTGNGIDRTADVTQWQITRESSSADADAIWAQRSKVKQFNGTIDLYWSDDASINDIDLTTTITKFHITATIGSDTLTHTINI